MSQWKDKPWECPSCESEVQLVRNIHLPGGPPGSVRREATVVYDVRCGGCGAEYHATFKAESYKSHKVTTHHAKA